MASKPATSVSDADGLVSAAMARPHLNGASLGAEPGGISSNESSDAFPSQAQHDEHARSAKGKAPIIKATTVVSLVSSPSQPQVSSTPVVVIPAVRQTSTTAVPQRASGSSSRNQATVPPPPASFSISSILHELEADQSAQEDITAIAEIYGRSNLSLSNAYDSHRSPTIGIASQDHNEQNQSTLDIPAASHNSHLPTVQESPTSAGLSSIDLEPEGPPTSTADIENTRAKEKRSIFTPWQNSSQAQLTSGSSTAVTRESVTIKKATGR